MKTFLITIILFFVTYFFGFAQIQEYPKKGKTVFLYSFEKVTEVSQLDSLVADILKIKGITEAKVTSKLESGKGQLVFVVEQIITGTENVENINLIPVKDAILKYSLMPIECIIREPKK